MLYSVSQDAQVRLWGCLFWGTRTKKESHEMCLGSMSRHIPLIKAGVSQNPLAEATGQRAKKRPQN
jgi:hypothetical protein